MTTIVDAANVVGSRPDGWWHDRAGAARRLLTRMRAHGFPDDVVVVLEGRARAADTPGTHEGIRVVHADGSGDDRIVELADELLRADPDDEVTVVTSDRGLRARVHAIGARSLGPGWLLQQLDDTSD